MDPLASGPEKEVYADHQHNKGFPGRPIGAMEMHR